MLGFGNRCGDVQERFRIIQLGGDRHVAQFFNHDHGRFLVQYLVDGDHLAQLHQMLDDFGSLHGHLVSQVGHADGFRHVHFASNEFLRCGLVAAVVLLVAATTAAALATTLATCAPAVTAGRGCGLVGRLLARGVIRPGRSDFGGLDGLLRAGSGGLGVFLGAGRSTRLAGRLVQRARNRSSGGGGRLRLGGTQYLARTVQHFAQRGGFGLGGTAGLIAATRRSGGGKRRAGAAVVGTIAHPDGGRGRRGRGGLHRFGLRGRLRLGDRRIGLGGRCF
ncbi:hypothetical protein D3C85_1126270 [compost metagenome]